MLSNLLEKIRGRSTEPQSDEQLVPMAAATLFMEVAWADHEIAEDELAQIRVALIEQFDLVGEDVDEIIEESRKHHDDSVGLYQFTRTINDAWQESEKFDLVVRLWRLALADDRLDKFEEHMIRKIAELLYLSHARFIQAKQIARQA